MVAVALGLVSAQLVSGTAAPTAGPFELAGSIGLLVSAILILRTLVEILGPRS